MNKKIFAGVTALVMMMSGVLCGCNSEKNTNSDESSTSSSSKSDSASKDNEKKDTKTSSKDKIYTDYLSQQKLCTISKNFKILEAGTARDNPNGLAGAVRYDFDGDKTDELVTFTFDRNSTNGEDIRVDLLTVKGKSLEVMDSRYLTEMLDMDFLYPEQKGNTIYYTDASELQIVQSQYDEQMHFGILLKDAGALGGLSLFNTKYSVFTIKDNKIETVAIGAVINEAVRNVSYAKQIPPSISDMKLSDTARVINDKISQSPESANREKSNIDEMTVDSEKYNLFTDSHSFDGSYQIEGGAYESSPQAFSAMLNEFGLDIDDAYNQSEYNFVSKNQSKVKTLIQIEQIKPFDGSSVMEYLGAKLTLDSDLETLLNNDNLFTEPFADELALYEDILRYPYYYHEIWDICVEKDGSGASYVIADINGDGKKEMIMQGHGNENRGYYGFEYAIAVMPDGTSYQMKHNECEHEFYDNGIIRAVNYNSVFTSHYIDTQNGETWIAENENGQSSNRIIKNADGSKTYSGEEAKKIEEEWVSGAKLVPEFRYHDINNQNDINDLNVVEDISEITYTWQKAYLSAIDEFKEIGQAPYGTEYEYALLYIDDNDIPELYITDKNTGISGLYTYYNRDVVLISHAASARANSFFGYIKNKGIFVIYNSGGMYYWGHEIRQLSDGSDTIIDTFSCEDEVYYINDKEVTEKAFEEQFAKYSDQFSEITYSSEADMKMILNGEKTDQHPVNKPTNNDDRNSVEESEESGKTATVKADGGLNMRKDAGTEYDKITLIPDGSTVEVIEEKGEWSKVEYKTYTGWVKSSYLR